MFSSWLYPRLPTRQPRAKPSRKARTDFSASLSAIDSSMKRSKSCCRRHDMFKEEEIRTFVEGTTNYFETSAQQSATVGSPYLVTDGKPGAYEYTGVIGITGARKGVVYFTASRGLLTVFLMRMQETDTS